MPLVWLELNFSTVGRLGLLDARLAKKHPLLIMIDREKSLLK